MTIATAGDGLLQAILEEPDKEDLRLIYADWLKENDAWVPEALFRHVKKYPMADWPRLLYADCLEEHGDPVRAEFIRVQVAEAARHTCACAPSLFVHESCTTCESIRPLRRRWRELLAGLADQFRPPTYYSWCVAGYMDAATSPVSWVRRGFVDDVSCSATAWILYRTRLVGRHPITKVRLTDLFPLFDGPTGKYYWDVRKGPGRHTDSHHLTADLIGSDTVALRTGTLWSSHRAPAAAWEWSSLHPTWEAAQDWLSAHLLRHAEEVARDAHQ